MRVATSLSFLGAGLLALAGCGSEPEPIHGSSSELRAFADCTELENYLRESASSAASLQPYSHTETNTQIAGVDEADIVETDGRRIFVLSGNQLFAVHSWPVNEMSLGGSLYVAGTPRDLFLDEAGRIVVISDLLDNGYRITKATVIDARDETDLALMKSFYVYGSYRGARRTGASVRIMTSYSMRVPVEIERAQLGDFLPPNFVEDADGTRSELLRECASFRLAPVAFQRAMSAVATIELGSMSLQQTSVIGAPGVFYASRTSLYLVNDLITRSAVHRFDLRDPRQAVYVASGSFGGTVRDQFSLDEYGGFLRVVTTNGVSVLAQSGTALKIVGSYGVVDDATQIRNVRFFGPRAFVATSGAGDPLITFDLSDPTAPVPASRVDFPGYATYLQMIDGTHLLAIGGYPRSAIALSLFDVSDLKKPQLVSSIPLGYGMSEAAFQHRAVTYFQRRGVLAVPVWNGWTSQLRIFSIDGRTGITPLGGFAWGPWIRRSVMADDVAYAVSDAGVRAASISMPSKILGTVRFRRISRY